MFRLQQRREEKPETLGTLLVSLQPQNIFALTRDQSLCVKFTWARAAVLRYFFSGRGNRLLISMRFLNRRRGGGASLLFCLRVAARELGTSLSFTFATSASLHGIGKQGGRGRDRERPKAAGLLRQDFACHTAITAESSYQWLVPSSRSRRMPTPLPSSAPLSKQTDTAQITSL